MSARDDAEVLAAEIEDLLDERGLMCAIATPAEVFRPGTAGWEPAGIGASVKFEVSDWWEESWRKDSAWARGAEQQP
jgi:hypothetical protein